MATSICIGDSSIPLAVKIAGTLSSQKKSVLLLNVSKETVPFSLTWNRSSILSAQTIPIEMHNNFAEFNKLVLFFDARVMLKLVFEEKEANLGNAVDEFIKGPLLLVSAVVDFFKKQQKGQLIFAVYEPSKQTEKTDKKNILVSVAEAAFMRMAEQYAFLCSSDKDYEGLKTLLISYSDQNQNETLDWLVQSIEAEPSKNQSLRWHKAGTRGIFSF